MFKSLPIKKGYYDMGYSGIWVIHALFVKDDDDDVMIDLQSTNKPNNFFTGCPLPSLLNKESSFYL